MNLFRKKDIAHLAQDAEKSGFVRNLTAFDLVFLGIGSVIGTGIFVLTGVGAALYAGPGIAISFILASVACAFAGLAYAEYSSMVPVSGSAYAYTYASLGEFMAFLVGWNLILEYTVTCSTVCSWLVWLCSGFIDIRWIKFIYRFFKSSSRRWNYKSSCSFYYYVFMYFVG